MFLSRYIILVVILFVGFTQYAISETKAMFSFSERTPSGLKSFASQYIYSSNLEANTIGCKDILPQYITAPNQPWVFDGTYRCKSYDEWGSAMVVYIGAQEQNCGSRYVRLSGGCESQPFKARRNLGDAKQCGIIFKGNPIHSSTGNKFQVETDYVSNGLSPLRWIRYYNSQNLKYTTLGRSWRHHYERSITYNDSYDLAILLREDAKEIRFQLLAGKWVSDNDISSSLEKTTTGWLFHPTNNTTEEYDLIGKLISISHKNGLTENLTYNTNNTIGQVTDSLGNSLTLTYNENNKIASVLSSTGQSWDYTYDTAGFLEYVTNPDNSTKQYHYQSGYLLTGITDERGKRYATFSYDSQNRANLTTHAHNAGRLDFIYETDGSTSITNSRNISSTSNFIVKNDIELVSSITGPGCSSCGVENTTYTYDDANNVLTKTKNGITTEYGDYDEKGQYGFIIQAKGTAEERRLNYTWDNRFYNKVSTISLPSEFSSGLKTTTFIYDDNGNVISKSINGFKPVGTAISRTFALEYSGPYNQLSLIDGPRTDVIDTTTFNYYADNPIEGNNRARLKSVSNALGFLRNNIQYSSTGKILSESRANGINLIYSYYSGNDRLEKITESDGTNQKITRWTYLLSGEVESITKGFGSSSEIKLTFGYDDARRLISISDTLGNKIQYTLDTEGNHEKEDKYDPQNNLTFRISNAFDDYNRLNISQRVNQITDTDFNLDGNLEKVTDGKGVVTSYSYDALKRLASTTMDVGGIDLTTRDALVQYGYDAGNRLKQVIDPINGTTQYIYDDLGNLLTQTSPDTGTKLYTYDAAGNVLTKTDAMQTLFSYQYDVINRVLHVNAPGTTDDISYTYDNCSNGMGRLCSVVYGDGTGAKTVTNVYDAFGSITSHQNINYTYDDSNKVKTITYPSGNIITYSYDVSGQVKLVELTQSGVTTLLASNITYTSFGPVKSLTYGNNLVLSQTFDEAYRATNKHVENVLALSYPLYDANGNIEQINNNETLVNNTYSYDSQNRLRNASGSFGALSYEYDKNGNRTNKTEDILSTIYSYKTNSNQLTDINNNSVVINANGNITHKELWTYNSNVYNRLVSISYNSIEVARYEYNGLGQRISKQSPEEKLFTYGLDGKLLSENEAGDVLDYVFLNGRLLAVISSAGTYYIHTDHLGTPRAITNESNTPLWSWHSDPFGKTLPNEDVDGDGVGFEFNLRFAGQYYDKETNLHYNYFRDYDPSTGRYVQSDPIGLLGGLNTYGYVGGNPLSYTDPYGLFQFGTRPLGKGKYQVPLAGNHNYWHEHGFYEDGSGGNVGYGPDGIFGNKTENNDPRYEMSEPYYDDDIMRQADKNLRKSGVWLPDGSFFSFPQANDYDLSGHNCQDFSDALRKEYQSLGGKICEKPFQNVECK